ncbi:hypothetical protein HYPSUDRAFT_214157 [Hypholoma sublateritium FD-334 SS-4]|uniref:Uncharacterized protein n=1 Tax=Hypholoma sublateritium (strain FD-334 SS-4) TaxID=945553 RepID=A0A0D2P968_HYPSF|nr:hypothetical protein HYPSUDRAFT_214157 [Hypholoma sublateritium FD-334 SS-4]
MQNVTIPTPLDNTPRPPPAPHPRPPTDPPRTAAHTATHPPPAAAPPPSPPPAPPPRRMTSPRCRCSHAPAAFPERPSAPPGVHAYLHATPPNRARVARASSMTPSRAPEGRAPLAYRHHHDQITPLIARRPLRTPALPGAREHLSHVAPKPNLCTPSLTCARSRAMLIRAAPSYLFTVFILGRQSREIRRHSPAGVRPRRSPILFSAVRALGVRSGVPPASGAPHTTQPTSLIPQLCAEQAVETRLENKKKTSLSYQLSSPVRRILIQ